MLKDCSWSEDRDYKSGTENEPFNFYSEALNNSSKFDLLLGYFSSAAIHLLSVGFASFISKNNGEIRIVINHFLSVKDKEILSMANSNSISNKVFDITDGELLKNILNEFEKVN